MIRHDWSRRAEGPEQMDLPDCSREKLERTLGQFRVINFLFTRYRHILKQEVLSVIARQPGREYRFTDLGAGGCDMARWLVRRCRRRGLRLRVRAVERDPRIRAYAQSAIRGYPEIEIVAADALDVQAWGEPDFLFVNHLLHHLPDREAAELLRLADRSGARYLISDLVRCRISAWAFALAVAPTYRHSFLLTDGLLSFRRGFMPKELRTLIDSAGLRHRPTVNFLFPARFLIAGGDTRHK